TPSSDSTSARTAVSGPSRTRLGDSTRHWTRKLPPASSTVALLLVPPLSRPTTTGIRIDCPPLGTPSPGRSAAAPPLHPPERLGNDSAAAPRRPAAPPPRPAAAAGGP